MDIEIKIDDDRHFIDVAPIVDREDFADEIKRIRAELGIKFPMSEEEASRIETEDQKKQVAAEIEKSRKHLYLPVVFRKVIGAVVYRNEVTNDDYSPAYLTCEWDTFDAEGQTIDETYSIVLSPGVRDVDVLKAYQQYRDQLGDEKGIKKYKYIHQIWGIYKKPSIKKFRRWYIAIKKLGHSYGVVCDDQIKNCKMPAGHPTGKKKPKGCSCYDESTVRRGVETYEKLIRQTPNL